MIREENQQGTVYRCESCGWKTVVAMTSYRVVHHPIVYYGGDLVKKHRAEVEPHMDTESDIRFVNCRDCLLAIKKLSESKLEGME